MKRIVVFVLIMVILVSHSIGFAEKGDYIHTGLKKAYDVKKPGDRDALIMDLKDTNVNKNLFYREVDGRKYVNVDEEAEAQAAKLAELLQEEGVDPKDADAFFKNPANKDKVAKMQSQINNVTSDIKEFSDIEPEFTKEYYYGGSTTYAPRLNTPENYSIPVPGTSLGTTMISELKLPSNATKWVYKVGSSPYLPKPDDEIADAKLYAKGTSIAVKVDDYLLLCATNLNNRVKAYASIKITSDMVKMPRVPAELADDTSMEVKKGTDVANAIKVSGLPNGNWSYFIRSEKSNIYIDDKFDDANIFDSNKDIIVANDTTLIDDNFVGYVYFINTDEKKDIVNYIVKEVKKADISLLPEKLIPSTNYIGPVQGSDENTTQFSDLKLDGTGGTKWQYKIGADVNVPIADSSFGGMDYAGDINAKVGDKLILGAVDVDGKIKAYALFTLTDAHVKGATPPKFNPPIVATKGNATNTTKASGLTLPEGATKFMYAIGNNIPSPALDRIYIGAKDYNLGDDILVEVGQSLYVFATDSSGKVKMYDVVELDSSNIKSPLATELKETTNYTKPVKGISIGSTQIGYLNYDGVSEWKYIVSKDEVDIPELDSKLDSYTGSIESKKDIVIASTAELKVNDFRRNMIIYGLDSSSNIKAYKKFILDNFNVKMPDAGPLVKGAEIPANYSEPKKGNGANTTRIEFLEHTGLNSTVFKYKVVDDITIPEFNEKMEGTREIRTNMDIPTTTGKYLLLLAVDKDNRTKAYANIELSYDTNVKAGNAPKLASTTNYKGPAPGDSYSSTKFTYLNLPSGASKWFYKIGDTSFGIPEAGSVVTDYKPYNPYGDIADVAVGKYLLLLAVDDSHKVISYVEFNLTDAQVKGSQGVELKTDNYSVMKGDKPGTTKLKLEPLGFENPTSIRWRYKLTDDNTEIPSTNEVVAGSVIYNVNASTGLGADINALNGAKSYEYILILATDTSGKTKKYVYVKLDSTNVKESAPAIAGITFGPGSVIDTTKATGTGNLKYLISTSQPDAPAVDDSLPNGVVDYVSGNDISIKIGQYLSIYDVDSTKVKGYSSIQITSNHVKQGSATLSGGPLLEGNIKNGGSSFTITLNGATWASDIVSNKSIRDKLFNGFKVDSEAAEWSKVVASMIVDGKGAISVNNSIMTILLPQTLDYDIKEEQKISLVIPAEAIEGAINPIDATGTITIKPTIGATVSGDVISSTVRQSDIKSGGKTIVVELADGIWNTDVSGIIDGFSGGINWNNVIKPKIQSENIVRNSGTKVTITLPPVDTVNFGVTSETISLKISKSLIQDATEDVIASPNFTLYPDILQVKGEAVKDSSDKDIPVVLMAPDYRIADTNGDIWTIKVTTGTLKDTITNSDIIVSSLPKGLTTNVSKTSINTIEIKVSGTASTALASDLDIKVKVKGTAVTEPSSVDSDEIGFKLIKGDSLIGDLAKVKVDVPGKTLTNADNRMEYSLNSTNGTNGTWHNATATDIDFKPGKVYIREKSNPKVFHLVATLNHGKAPTGIVISEVDYNSGLKIKLNGFETDIFYDYSTDGGTSWTELNISNPIDLTKDSDLRIRYSATRDNLPSLATPKLNGLYLGSITMNVGEGKIIGTTTAMEYSLNNGDTYTTAKANETPVSFIKDGVVMIRERSKPLNKYTIGTVGIEADIIGSINFDILSGTITAGSESRTLQHRIGTDSWRDVPSPPNKIEFKPGTLQIRTKGTKDNLPSNSIEFIIANPASAPELTVDDFTKDISYWKDSSEVALENESSLEYKINDGPWKVNDGWKDDKKSDTVKNGNPKISVRFKATVDKLPSLIKTINFTGNLTFENVKLNVVEGKIEGTTTAMQYSIDSTDGLNGTWIDAKVNSTSVSFVKDMKVFIREKSKPLNVEALTGINGIGTESPISSTDFNYSIINGSITNNTTKILEYKIGAETWKSIDRSKTVYEVEFKQGTLQVRARGTESTLPSSPISIDIKAKASPPQLKYDDVKYEIIGIDSTDAGGNILYEYNINGGSWISGDVNTQFEGGNVVLIRLKATNDTLPSLEQKITFTNNLDFGNVILNAGKLQLENTSTLMEYSLDSTNGEDGLWFQCTTPNTNIALKEGMTVHIREKAKPRNSRKITETAVGVKAFANGENFVKDNIDYNIQQGTISIKNIAAGHQKLVNDLQYRIGNGNWINIDYVGLTIGDTKVLVYNVNFTPGNLEFRLKGNENELPSKSILKAIILAPASAPNVSVGFDLGNYRNSVNYGVHDKADLEYSFGSNGPWINGTHLDTEDLVGNVYIRTKADKDTLPSLTRTLEFTPVLNLKTIILSTHVQPLELNGTTAQMEYRINNGIWQNCSDGNTKLKRNDGTTDLNNPADINIIEIRDKNQTDNMVTVYP